MSSAQHHRAEMSVVRGQDLGSPTADRRLIRLISPLQLRERVLALFVESEVGLGPVVVRFHHHRAAAHERVHDAANQRLEVALVCALLHGRTTTGRADDSMEGLPPE